MTAAGGAPRGDAATDRYEMVVGLEVHVQLATRTKIFCDCSTDFGAPPNANTCPVCLGLPGALPVLNYQAVELATRVALALGCDVARTSVFARKNYFYPDLPKGYQISQFDRPLATGGQVRIGETPEGAPILVGVTRVHLEEDAGRSVHDRFEGATAVDLNRAGVPLIEIVSEPDMRSAAEAGAYLRAVKQLVQYVGASDANMEEGSLRVDANISVRERGDTKLGTKSEIKNMNSFSAVDRALEAEFRRQCATLAGGGRVRQETLLWDAARNEVRPARAKEGSHDYRYFPEPDLRPLLLTKEWIEARRAALPELPTDKRQRFADEYGLGADDVDAVLSEPALADYFESVARQHGDAKTAANWIMRDVLAAMKEHGWTTRQFQLQVRPADLAALLDMVRDGVVTHSAAARVFTVMVRSGEPPRTIAEVGGLLRVGDEGRLRAWVDEVLAEHPAEAERYLGGERRLQGVLVGHVMRKSGGSADPKLVNALLAERVRG